MRRYLVPAATALAIVAAAPLVAQGMASAPGQKNAALITGGTYQADPNHTLVEWELNHLGFSPYFGLFGDVTGTLQLDPKAPQNAKVSVTIPISKVTTASKGLTDHLLRAPKDAGGKPDFFGPSPADATFVSTSVKPTGAGKANVTGNLTFNGVTKPVTLATTFYGAGKMPAQMGGAENVGFEATTTIKRSEFNFGNMVPMLSDEVKLKIAAAFTKK
ncbi:polyisoprenoid-binding protein YceI [Novosphingobium chloroacetimidivorans]|uniref:Polyisoprenoid-binding protein YceI n=1 Tax=Novosphingobium chloroacetimidivorans TaxID=1428314 RepID=A0A7W7NYS1_9SPHN|nr:YceI family protein [Novosphingobium chloroacetimidivorans]MBB4860467.1 polyisoprenoid-binding protein YceI [Novosphingobium chloroacetimidivorans]